MLEVVIKKIVPGGFGLAFAENLTVFVALAAAGDSLRVRVNQIKGKIAFAEIVEILTPSPDRTEPRCPYFGRCGGCDFQHLDYAAQLRAKIAILQDCLTRIGKINLEQEITIIGSPNDYEYRTRAEWHLDSRRQKIGYFQRQSHDIIDVEICPILVPSLQDELKDLREHIEFDSFWAEIVAIEAASGDAAVSVYSDEIMETTDEINFRAAGENYFYDAQTFFQGNKFLVEDLIKIAVGDAEGANALDLYCGVGLFTLPLARKFAKVTGVEGDAKAVAFAAKNIECAELGNAAVFAANVVDWLAENSAEKFDFVVLDPPRSGVEKPVIEHLLRLKPQKISYVSCEPSTLARDLRVLLDGGYQIDKIVALDLFPQTHHVETVVRLRLE